MSKAFADTFYWVASINPGDSWYSRVRQLTATLEDTQIVTTDEVLSEVLTFFAGQGQRMRQRAVQLVNGIMSNSNILVVPQTHDSFLQGVILYENRADKGYSLNDCISMNTMRQLNIQDVLTHDRHFQQEGFRVLFDI